MSHGCREIAFCPVGYFNLSHPVYGYVLPTNLHNFIQKGLTEVKIFQKVLGGSYFLNIL